MNAIKDIFFNLDWSPLFISLKTGIVATIFSFFLGLFTAYKIVKLPSGKKGSYGRNIDVTHGSSSYSCRILSAFAIQQKAPFWNLSI